MLTIFFLAALLSSCINTTPAFSKAAISYAQHDYHRSFNILSDITDLANHEDPRAQYALGYLYYYGLGVAMDQDIGREWIKKSAAHCYPPAVVALKEIMNGRHQQYTALE